MCFLKVTLLSLSTLRKFQDFGAIYARNWDKDQIYVFLTVNRNIMVQVYGFLQVSRFLKPSQTEYRTMPMSQRIPSCCPLYSDSLLTPGRWKPLICFLFLYSCLSKLSYKQNHRVCIFSVCGFFHLASCI